MMVENIEEMHGSLLDLVSEMQEKDITYETILPRLMDGHRREKLVDQLYDVAVDAFGRDLPREAIADRTHDSDIVLLLREFDQVVGYSSNEIVNLDGREANYYSTLLLRRSVQGRGLSAPMYKLRWLMAPSEYLITRTQNPVIFKAFDNLANTLGYQVYPQPDESIPGHIIKLAKTYDPDIQDDLVSKGIYFGRSLMFDTPRASGKEIALWKNIDVEAGDGIFFVAERKS